MIAPCHFIFAKYVEAQMVSISDKDPATVSTVTCETWVQNQDQNQNASPNK